jgi:hypothetical protein
MHGRSVKATAQEGSAESATSVRYIPDELASAGGGLLRQGVAHDLVALMLSGDAREQVERRL